MQKPTNKRDSKSGSHTMQEMEAPKKLMGVGDCCRGDPDDTLGDGGQDQGLRFPGIRLRIRGLAAPVAHCGADVIEAKTADCLMKTN